MYYNDTEDLYTIPEEDQIKEKNIYNIKSTVSKDINNYSEKNNKNIQKIEKSPINVNKEVKYSQKNSDLKNIHPINKDNSSIDLNDKYISFNEKLGSNPTVKVIKPNNKNQKENNDSINLSAILDETETNKNYENNKNKIDNNIKNVLDFQGKNTQFNKQVIQPVNKAPEFTKKDKPKDDSINLSSILDETTNNKQKVSKINENPMIKNEDFDKNHQNNYSISDISIQNQNNISKNYFENKDNKDYNSISTIKNTTTQPSNYSKITSNKVKNGGGVKDYIQNKLSQIEIEFTNSKHQIDKMLLNDESKLIHYESRLEYTKASDLMKKQKNELMKYLEIMNNNYKAIVEATNVVHNQKESKVKRQSKVKTDFSNDVDSKIITVYKNEYNTITSRLSLISEPNYLSRIETILTELNRQISQLEIENKMAKIEHKQTDIKIGKTVKNVYGDSNQNIEIKKINYDYEHYHKQYNIANTRINKNKDDIEIYNERIIELNENYIKLIEIGSFYGITQNEIKEIEDSLKTNIPVNNEILLDEKKNVLLRKIEIIKKVQDQLRNKYESKIKLNLATIHKLENSKKELFYDISQKSKIAKDNNIKLREFYDSYKNNNVSDILKDFNKTNETSEQIKQNTTNYSYGNPGRKQVLMRISEESDENIIPTEIKNTHLLPIEEKDRYLEETVERDNSVNFLKTQKLKENEDFISKVNKNPINTVIQIQEKEKDNKIAEIKPKENNIEVDKYGIKSKPKFKAKFDENIDSQANIKKISDLNEKIQEKDHNKLEKNLEKISDVSKENNIKISSIILEKKPEISKEKIPSTEITTLETKEILKNKNVTYIELNNITSKTTEVNEISNLKTNKAIDDPIFDDTNMRRKKHVFQQNNSFLPIIENKEAKVREDREKIRGQTSQNDKISEKFIKSEEPKVHKAIKENTYEEKIQLNDNIKAKEIYPTKLTTNEENNNIKANEIYPTKLTTNEENNIPLFLQNTSNKALLETNQLITNKMVKDSKVEVNKELKRIKDEPQKLDSPLKEKVQKPQEKKEIITNKKDIKKEIPILNDNKNSLFSNIFNDDDDDVLEKKPVVEKRVPTKNKEDFDKLFSKDISSNIITDQQKETDKQRTTTIVKENLEKTNNESKEKAQDLKKDKSVVKKKNPLDDLDDLII